MASKRPTLQRSGHSDHFQTPPGPVQVLTPWLPPGASIWDPSCGDEMMVNELRRLGFAVRGTDVRTGTDFLEPEMAQDDDSIVVTNPPYSVKSMFLCRCYQRNRPFALLLPLTTLDGHVRQQMFRRYGLQLLLWPGRVNFHTPSGRKSSAWFDVAWFTWGLHLPRDLMFVEGPE